MQAAKNAFFENYDKVHADFKGVRTTTCMKISNRVELRETLRKLGYTVRSDGSPIVEAVAASFSCWAVKPFEGVEAVLRNLGGRFTIGIETNFMDHVFVYKCLRELKLLDLLDCVIILAEVGLRKPSPKIFQRFTQLTGTGTGDSLFVGYDVTSDVVGAKVIGFKTVLINRESNNKVAEFLVQPDFALYSTTELEGVVDSEMDGD